jgi:nucleoside-diphosphate kinase
MASGPVVAIELVGPDAINRWRSMIGPTDSQKAKEQGPHLLRARFGTGLNFIFDLISLISVHCLDGTRNALHGSDSTTSAQREISYFFGSKYGTNTACYNDTTCCIIKPHAVAEGKQDNL